MTEKFKVGTLINDRGRIGVIRAVVLKGQSDSIFHWRDNYEIIFADNTKYVIGVTALHRLTEQGDIKIISNPADAPFY